MISWDQHTIFLALGGSHAHGTARAESDLDLRGVCIAPLPLRLSISQHFEQYEGALPEALAPLILPRLRSHPSAMASAAIKTECVLFDIAKFVRLCAAANPNALEILFTAEPDWLLSSAAWKQLHAARHHFLTKKIGQTFLGYALGQWKRISSRREPSPTRNPHRAALERAHGYDTKHALHLIRLLRMASEALATGDLQVRRHDASELTAILHGTLSFDELDCEASMLRGRLQKMLAQSSLPEDVDPSRVDALVFELITTAARE